MIVEYKHGINVKVPLNLFNGLYDDLQGVKEVISNKNKAYYKAKTDLEKRMISNQKAPFLRKKKEIEEHVSAIWFYLRVKAFDYNRNKFLDKDFTRYLADQFGMHIKHMRVMKNILLNHGFAMKQGDLIMLRGNDHVWESAGLLVAEHKIGEDGKRIKIKSKGVYTSTINKKKIVKIGEKLKSGKTATQDIYKDCEHKVRVPIIKLKVNEAQIRDLQEFKAAVALAMIKRLEDHDNSKTEPKQRKDAQDGSIELSSQWFSRQLGYAATASGWHTRNRLQDCGFISITEVKQTIDTNKTYQEAKDGYDLQAGIDPDDGWAKYFSNGNVIGVKCFRVKANGYVPIKYPILRRKKPKVVDYIVQKGQRVATKVRETREEKWAWFTDQVDCYIGKTLKTLHREMYFLFEDFGSVSSKLHSLFHFDDSLVITSGLSGNLIKGCNDDKTTFQRS